MTSVHKIRKLETLRTSYEAEAKNKVLLLQPKECQILLANDWKQGKRSDTSYSIQKKPTSCTNILISELQPTAGSHISVIQERLWYFVTDTKNRQYTARDATNMSYY